MKTIYAPRLHRALSKAKAIPDQKHGCAHAQTDSVLVKTPEGFHRLHCSEIRYFNSKGNFSEINFLTQKPLLILVSLKQLEEQHLHRQFQRIHKNHLVNLAAIMLIAKEHIQCPANLELPLGASFRLALLAKMASLPLLHRTAERKKPT